MADDHHERVFWDSERRRRPIEGNDLRQGPSSPPFGPPSEPSSAAGQYYHASHGTRGMQYEQTQPRIPSWQEAIRYEPVRYEPVSYAAAESPSLTTEKTPRYLPRSAWDATKPRLGNVPVLVWAKRINDWVPTDAHADTGSLGKDANVVSPKFLEEDLGYHQYHYDSHDPVSFRGLGGTGRTEGSISLKIKRLYRDQSGERVRDNGIRVPFHIHPGFQGDLLLGRDFLEQNESFQPHWAIKDKPTKQSQNDSDAGAAERQRREASRLSLQRQNADHRSQSPSQYTPYSTSPQPGYGSQPSNPTHSGPGFGMNGNPTCQQNGGYRTWGLPNERDEAHARYNFLGN